MRKDTVLVMLAIVLLTLSEITLLFNQLLGVIVYATWLLALIIILTTKLTEPNKDLFTALATIPTIRIFSLLLPIKGLYQMHIVYALFFVLTLINMYYLKIHPGERYKSKKYLLMIIPLFLASFFRYFYETQTKMSLDYQSIALIIFISITLSLFFYYVIQNMLEKAFGFKGVVFTSIIITALSLGQYSIVGIGLTFITGLILGLIYYENRRWYLIVIILSLLNILELIVLPYLRV